MSRWKDYVYLRYQVRGTENYLPWNIHEKVLVVEDHQHNYVVIVLQAVDDSGKEIGHVHSIVINVHAQHPGKFDLATLMDTMDGTPMQSLNKDFRRMGYVPWKDGSTRSIAQRLHLIWQSLDRYTYKNKETKPIVGGITTGGSRGPKVPQSRPSTSASLGRSQPAQSQPRSQPQKRVEAASEPGESSKKRRKSSAQALASAAVSGSASGLTNVSASAEKEETPLQDHKKFALILRDFWAEHKDCFLLEMETVSVPILQCIIADDRYIIRTLQKDIVEAVRNQLIKLGDIEQRQKVCLTPVDGNGNLLKKKPQKWDEIKRAQFMIINGQHSITASKQLQDVLPHGDKRRSELQAWEAFIVWSLDADQLRNISRFYNCTNHLNLVQPTWGNQIISCRNIWLVCKRPSDIETEGSMQQNGAIFDYANFTVGAIV